MNTSKSWLPVVSALFLSATAYGDVYSTPKKASGFDQSSARIAGYAVGVEFNTDPAPLRCAIKQVEQVKIALANPEFRARLARIGTDKIRVLTTQERDLFEAPNEPKFHRPQKYMWLDASVQKVPDASGRTVTQCAPVVSAARIMLAATAMEEGYISLARYEQTVEVQEVKKQLDEALRRSLMCAPTSDVDARASDRARAADPIFAQPDGEFPRRSDATIAH